MKITTNYQLNFNPANNCKNNRMQKSNPQFKARFTAEQLKEMTKFKEFGGSKINVKKYIPNLYTLLAYFDEICHGDLAKWDFDRKVIELNGYTFCPNTNSGCGDRLDYWEISPDPVNILMDELVAQDEWDDDNDDYFMGGACEVQWLEMPKKKYVQKRYENRNKTADDIINDFAYENLK